jgi:sulfite exporter TauE/SafE
MLALFAAGTLPALMGFGLISRLFTRKMTFRFLQASGIILIILGSIMFYRGIQRSWPENQTAAVPVRSCCQPAEKGT